MWRPTMFLMCLIAALSGTPLRQAEAASDFARSLADRADDPCIETIDGGVGDDSGDTILNVRCDLDSSGAMIPVAMADVFLSPRLATVSCPGDGHEPPPDWVATLSAGSRREHAWLQCFLF
jgi:hypothetical protein